MGYGAWLSPFYKEKNTPKIKALSAGGHPPVSQPSIGTKCQVPMIFPLSVLFHFIFHFYIALKNKGNEDLEMAHWEKIKDAHHQSWWSEIELRSVYKPPLPRPRQHTQGRKEKGCPLGSSYCNDLLSCMLCRWHIWLHFVYHWWHTHLWLADLFKGF